MGVTIFMTPGPIGRNFGEQVDITPHARSQAAKIMREHWGESPIQLVEVQDWGTVALFRDGASIYVTDKENIWKIIADALEQHQVVTIVMEY